MLTRFFNFRIPFVRRLAMALLSLLIVLSAIVLETTTIEDIVQPIDVSDVRQRTGFDYQYALPDDLPDNWFFSTPPDNNNNLASTLRLERNGEPFGRQHATHAEIKDVGDGRYSHWANLVLFSLPENADISDAGDLSFRITPAPTPFMEAIRLIGVLFLLFALFSLKPFLSKSQDFRLGDGIASFSRVAGKDIVWRVYLFGFALLILTICLYLVSGFVLFQNDSVTYIQFKSLVPAGYPIFVNTIRIVAGYAAISIVQLILMVAAITWFCDCARKVLQLKLTAFLLPILLFSYFPQFQYAAYALTEAVSFTLTYVLLAVLLLSFRAFRSGGVTAMYKYVYWVGFLIGCLLFVRPAYIYMIGIIPGLVFFSIGKQGIALALRSALPLVGVMLFSTFLSTFVIEESTKASQSSRNLVGHVSPLYHPDFSEFNEAIEAEIYAITKPYGERMDNAKTPQEHQLESSNTFNQRLSEIDLKLNQIVLDMGLRGDDHAEMVNELRWAIALSTIREDFPGYVGYVYTNYLGAWDNTTILPYRWSPSDWLKSNTRDSIVAYNASVAERLDPKPDPRSLIYPAERIDTAATDFLDTLHHIFSPIEWPQAVVILSSLMGVIFMFCIPFFAPRMTANALFIGYLSMLVQAGLIFTTMITAAIPRYGIPFEIMILIQFLFLIDWTGFMARDLLDQFVQSARGKRTLLRPNGICTATMGI